MEPHSPSIQEPSEMPPPPSVKKKDPKKQEAGRLGAAARKAKEKRILEELAATVKERIYSEADVSTSAPQSSIDPQPNADLPPRLSNSTETKLKLGTNDWFAAIGLAILLAGVIWFKRFKPYAKAPPARTPQEVPPPVNVAHRKTRSVFDME